MDNDRKKVVPVILLSKNGGRQIIGQGSIEHIGDGRVEVNMIITNASANLEPLVPFVTAIIPSFEARLGS